MKTNVIALIAGIVFGIGLSLAHMIDPDKVLNFLDVAGHWDPSLLLVMVGALSTAFIAFRLILKHPKPVWAETFDLPKKRAIDLKLVTGAAIFGIGWGISGYCPGPAVTGLGLFSLESVIMVLAIYVGFIAYHRLVDKK